jgi:hypothetical protein
VKKGFVLGFAFALLMLVVMINHVNTIEKWLDKLSDKLEASSSE